jgi:peptidoglycan/LPS O-acetylase OafA/YrhL
MVMAQPHLLRFGGITGSTFAPANVFNTSFELFAREILGGGLLRGSPRYNAALWTMPLELVGSYLIFAMVAIFGRSRHPQVVFAAAGLWILVIGSTTMLGFFAIYLIGFVIGIALADREVTHSLSTRRLRPSFGLALIVAFVYLGSYNGQSPPPRLVQVPWDRGFSFVGLEWFTVPIAHFAAATIAVYGVIHSRVLRRVLQTRLPRFLGSISFPIYLLHAPILVCVLPAGFLFLFDRGLSAPLAALAAVSVALSISLVAAVVFGKLVDQASIRLAHRAFPTPAKSPGLAMAAREGNQDAPLIVVDTIGKS